MIKLKVNKKLIIFIIMIFLILPHVVILIFYSLCEYKPANVEDAVVLNHSKKIQKINYDNVISILTWNIGSSLMSSDSNKYKKIKDKREYNYKNIDAFLNEHIHDIYFIQEANYDFIYTINSRIKKNYKFHFAHNHKDMPVLFIGKANVGLLIISKFLNNSSRRLKLPGMHIWPIKLFSFKRCMLENRYKIEENELVIYNIHLTFFDKNEKIKIKQINFIKKIILDEYEKGNYVIVGGDWNLSLSKVKNNKLIPESTARGKNNWIKVIPPSWKPKI